jgi:hypothetical protein
MSESLGTHGRPLYTSTRHPCARTLVAAHLSVCKVRQTVNELFYNGERCDSGEHINGGVGL